MISPWHRLIFAKNQHLLTLLCDRGSLNYWLCNHKSLKLMVSPFFPVLRNPDTQGHLIPQYDGINLFYMQQMKKAITMYGPHLPFTKELLNVVASSIGNFIPYDW